MTYEILRHVAECLVILVRCGTGCGTNEQQLKSSECARRTFNRIGIATKRTSGCRIIV